MREHNIYWDVNGRQAYSANGSTLVSLANDNLPYIGYKEKIKINLQLLNSALITDVFTGFNGVSIACEAAVDDNSVHYYEGALTAAKSGAVVTITADGFSGEDVYDTGTLYLRNAARQSETVAYTSYSLANGIYTFTVSKTLSYSYANNDTCRIISQPIIAIENAAIDQTDKDTGLFVLEVYAYTQPYQRKVLNKWEIDDCRIGFYALDATPNDICGCLFKIRCFNRLRDTAVIPPPPDESNYYTKSEADARYLELVGSSDIEITDASKGIILSFGAQRIRARIDYTNSIPSWVFDVL
jgi:hypothetical protein